MTHTWVTATTQGIQEWREARITCLNAYLLALGDPRGQVLALQALRRARTKYREWVLGWFWKLVAPIQLGECVPAEVAELLAEQWDLETGASS